MNNLDEKIGLEKSIEITEQNFEKEILSEERQNYSKKYIQNLQENLQNLIKFHEEILKIIDNKKIELDKKILEFSEKLKQDFLIKSTKIITNISNEINLLSELIKHENENLSMSNENQEIVRKIKMNVRETFRNKFNEIDEITKNIDFYKAEFNNFIISNTIVIEKLSKFDYEIPFLHQKYIEVSELNSKIIYSKLKFNEILTKNNELEIEQNTLINENAKLKEKYTKKQSEYELLALKESQMKDHIEQLQKQSNTIIQLICDKNKEVEILESILKRKQELNEKITKSLDSYKKDHESEIIAIKSYEEQKLMESKITHLYDPRHKTLYIYHFEMRKVIRAVEIPLPTNFESVQISDKIIVSGGFDVKKIEYSKSTIEIMLVNNENIQINKKYDMRIPKSQHKLVVFNTNEIYCLGGKNKTDHELNTCEIYNYQMNKWIDGPCLNQKKMCVSACSYLCYIIYCFGGYYNQESINTIEILKPLKENKWKLIKISESDLKFWQEAGCAMASDHEIMIFGGNRKSMGCTDEVLIFDTYTEKLAKSKYSKLPNKEWFANRNCTKHGGFMLIFGSHENDLYECELSKLEWKIIQFKEWIK